MVIVNYLSQEEIEMRKQFIMDKAIELFAKQGFEATSVQQITNYCGISKGAFYLSFKSKDELIVSIIDHFMEEFISDIDQIVKSTKNDELLYAFYRTIIESFYEHSSFGKIFIQEPMMFLKEELIDKARYYDTLLDKTILTIVERLYGEDISKTKYELTYCMKHFISMYSELLLFKNIDNMLDIDLLTKSLVEKTNILATHMETTFITEELFSLPTQLNEVKHTKDKIIALLDEKIETIDDAMTKESLILLKAHMLEPSLQSAVVAGLLENIQKHRHCKWIAFLLRNYFEL